MNIKQRLVRQSEEDQIYIGGIIKRAYNGQVGEVIRALIEGLKTKELSYHQENHNIAADRILGRCEGYQTVINELELMIDISDKLQEPIEESDEEE